MYTSDQQDPLEAANFTKGKVKTLSSLMTSPPPLPSPFHSPWLQTSVSLLAKGTPRLSNRPA